MSRSALIFGLFICFYKSHEGILGNVANREIEEDVILHKGYVRNRLHLEKCGELRLVIDVYLAKFYIGILALELLHHGREQLTGAAPIGVEIDNDKAFRLLYLGFKIFFSYIKHIFKTPFFYLILSHGVGLVKKILYYSIDFAGKVIYNKIKKLNSI